MPSRRNNVGDDDGCTIPKSIALVTEHISCRSLRYIVAREYMYSKSLSISRGAIALYLLGPYRLPGKACQPNITSTTRGSVPPHGNLIWRCHDPHCMVPNYQTCCSPLTNYAMTRTFTSGHCSRFSKQP